MRKVRQKAENRFVTSRAERISFGLYNFGTILVFYMVASFLQLFMTDIGIPAVTVGVIFLAAKVWDAVNDPVFGVMVDKLSFKKERYKPWLRIASIAIPITTVFLFIIPADATIQVKIIWSVAAYIAWDTAYTMFDVPFNALATAMSESLRERSTLYALAAFFVYLGGLLVAVAVPFLYPQIGWGPTSIIIAALAFISMLPLRFKAKERYAPVQNKELSVTELFGYLLRNKYLLVFTAATIIGAMTNFTSALAPYFAIHCLGGPGWITPLALATTVPVLVVSLAVPKLFSVTDKFKVLVITRIISLALDFTIFFAGYGNVALLITLIVIRQSFFAVWAVSGVMFIADCVEYGQYKNGRRAEGISFSIKAFTNKLVIALSGALGMFALGAYGFIEGEGVAQSAETINGIWMLYAIWPTIGTVISLIFLIALYKLRDRDVQIMALANTGEITRAEAEEKLAAKGVEL